jgi:PilZ domain
MRTNSSVERRKRTRMQLHWPLRFHKTTAEGTLETVTADISSEGFYCLVKAGNFVPGEALACTLGVPARYPVLASPAMSVDCLVRIVRIDPAKEDGLNGVGCRIEEYRTVVR